MPAVRLRHQRDQTAHAHAVHGGRYSPPCGYPATDPDYGPAFRDIRDRQTIAGAGGGYGALARLFGFIEQLADPHPQRSCNQPQIENREIPLTALDAADERPVQLAFAPQFELRESSRYPLLAQAGAQLLQESPIVEVHGR